MSDQSKCPVTGRTGMSGSGRGTTNRDWWPNQVNLKILYQHSFKSNPMGQALLCLFQEFYESKTSC